MNPSVPSLPTSSLSGSSSRGAESPRYLVLDVLRGLAICGILFTNIAALLVVSVGSPGETTSTFVIEHLLFKERFFPIFSFLFGISFAIIWRSASRRAAHPRVVLLRRLLALLAFGAVHVRLHPGEAPSVYGAVGLLVLLPATLIPERWTARVCALVGAALLVPGVVLGGVLEVPGLFLLGFAVGLGGLVARFEDSARPRCTSVSSPRRCARVSHGSSRRWGGWP